MSAALGVVQIGRLETLLKARDQVAAWYAELLADICEVGTPFISPTTSRMSWFVYVVRLDTSLDRSAVARRLAELGIPVRPYFLPIHLQPFMVEKFGYRRDDFPVTEDLGERGLAIPFSGRMTRDQVVRVCDALKKAVSRL